ncbi:hypothetical protein J1614_012262 [Plenodomus biglobosus]|nr:hypothetical protein J1614_012262 [Plenodomus biglobosus]
MANHKVKPDKGSSKEESYFEAVRVLSERPSADDDGRMITETIHLHISRELLVRSPCLTIAFPINAWILSENGHSPGFYHFALPRPDEITDDILPLRKEGNGKAPLELGLRVSIWEVDFLV